ncbi:glycoside hydrolase family 88 protein [Streptomyces sp. NPDC057654]|uniref:glycoside hydrolase family 88 protein n=1 Tax=Streptomyces sp. NPDC057654 TaxID=3346196 RepID=UPI00369EAF68
MGRPHPSRPCRHGATRALTASGRPHEAGAWTPCDADTTAGSRAKTGGLPGRRRPSSTVSPSGRPVLWSRGNGWVAGGLVKTLKALKALPGDAAHVPAYRAALVRLLLAARAVQRDDGFWNVSLADPAHFPGPETSGTAFLAYGTAYALRAGLVPARDFEAVAARAWHGLVTTAVHPDGFLGYVQGAGDRPESGQPVGHGSTADFGVGAFLLAGTELALLARSERTRLTP